MQKLIYLVGCLIALQVVVHCVLGVAEATTYALLDEGDVDTFAALHLSLFVIAFIAFVVATLVFGVKVWY